MFFGRRLRGSSLAQLVQRLLTPVELFIPLPHMFVLPLISEVGFAKQTDSRLAGKTDIRCSDGKVFEEVPKVERSS